MSLTHPKANQLLFTAGFWLFFTLGTAYPATWFVDKDNVGIQDGTSWATAFTTIQPAIDAAFADGGGEVWVAEGTYNEVRVSLLHSPPVDTGSLVLKDAVQLFGGFVGNETMLSQRDPINNVTVVDGSTSRGGSPAFHVVFGATNALIDGFTITGGVGGSGSPVATKAGGGIYNENVGFTTRNCVIDGNSAPNSSGGGIWTLEGLVLENSTLSNNDAALTGSAIRSSGTQTIRGCIFRNNISGTGGTVVVGGSGSAIVNCVFIGNTASRAAAISGGGDPLGQPLEIISCIFQDNVASGRFGGGALSLGGKVSIANCIFNGNSSAAEGGAIDAAGTIGMMASSDTNIQMANCTFWNNTAGSGGGAIHTDDVDIDIINTIFWNNGPTEVFFGGAGDEFIRFSDIQNFAVQGTLFTLGPGNINAEPFFVDAANGDFRVFSGSPIIDAGTSSGAPATDIDGIARPQGAEVDMGAHESDGSLAELSAAQVVALVTLTLILVLLILAKVKRVSHLI